MEGQNGEQAAEQAIIGGGQDLLARLTGNLGIRAKLLLSFLVILALTVIVAVVALVGQRSAGRADEEMSQGQNRLARLSYEAQADVDRMRRVASMFRQTVPEQGLDAARRYAEQFQRAAAEARAKLDAMTNLVSGEQKALTRTAIDAVSRYATGFQRTVDSLDQKYNARTGLLAKQSELVEQMAAAVRSSAATSPELVQRCHQLELGYYRFLLHANAESSAVVLEGISALKAAIVAQAANSQQAALKKLCDQFAGNFDALLKASEKIDTQFADADEAARQIDPALKSVQDDALNRQTLAGQRLQDSESASRYAILTTTILAICLGLFLAWFLSRGLTNQIDKIMALLSELGIGNFNARTEVVAQDELGVMASSLNAMLDNMTTMIQSQGDQEKLQEAFMKLMMEIDELTEGDLTVRAEVTEDVTGALADSVNTMAEQFGGIVRQVKDASNAVDRTAANVSKLTSDLAVRSLEQNKQVNNAIAAIHTIAESIRQVSRNAALSAEVSQTSRANARAGAEAVEQTHHAMDEIREQINETARSIKRLGESSMEIGNVVEIINSIADRTSILALNASIQAAMAGEAGHGFAVVAEEVQRLAESSSKSTKQIETLIKGIQAEIKDAGNRMDESISKVVQGSQLADGAYTKLQEIETVSNQLADLIQSISQSAAEQEERSEEVVASMVSVGEASTNTTNSTQATNSLMSVLNNTARELRSAVDAFKIESA